MDVRAHSRTLRPASSGARAGVRRAHGWGRSGTPGIVVRSLSGVLAGVLLLSATPLTLRAQWAKFGRLGREEGLSQTAVYALAQDREGFLWIGTQNGLNRYDGRTFRVDWSDGDRPSPVGFGLVQALLVDSKGDLWVGMQSHGLFLYDKVEEHFRSVPASVPDGSPLEAPLNVYDIADLGDVPIVATSEGVGRIERVSGSPVLRLQGGPSRDDCGEEAHALGRPHDGTLWVGTEKGCVRILDGASASAGTTVSLGIEEIVRGLAPGKGGTVWVGSTGGLFLLDGSGAVIARPEELGTVGERARVRRVHVDRGGDAWVATEGGLGFFPTSGSARTWYGMSDPTRGGLPSDRVFAVLEDASGGLWVGTWDGLARLSPFHRSLEFIPSSVIDPDMGGVLAFAASRSGSVLAGGVEGVIARLPQTSGRAGRAVAGADLGIGTVVSLAFDQDELWVATVATGVHRLGPDGWRAYRRGVEGAGYAVDDRFPAIAVDHSGVVWAGTVNHGLAVYDRDEDRFVAYGGPRDDFTYAADYIWPVAEDRSGALWFGANAQYGGTGGIHRLSPDRARLSTWTTGGDPERPNAGRVTTLTVSGDTVVWFGTQGAGLGRLTIADGSTRYYTTPDGLPHNTVAGILEDARGYLWISTEWGLARFDPRAERFWVFGEESGLQSSRFYFNAAFRSDDGRLYFGGPNGVNVVDPASLSPPTQPPPMVLTRFSVRGRARPEVNNLTARAGLDLAPGDNFFTLEMSALDFADETLNEYRYRLDPLDDGWVESGSSPVANYTSVPPDRYVFRAQVRRHGGDWQATGLSIPIVVHPFMHQTLWFKATVGLLVLGLISALYAYRLRELHRRQELRLSIAGKLHDDIGADLSTIAVKAGMVKTVSELDERSRSHLQDVVRLAVDSANRVRETVWVVNTRYDTVASLISRMCDTADEILSGNVSYTIDAPTAPSYATLSMETRQNIYFMFKETLHNVLKHASATRVEVEVRVNPGELAFVVEDDGVGFTPDRRDNGSGQALLHHRAAMCRGSVRVTSQPGNGTRVEVRARLR